MAAMDAGFRHDSFTCTVVHRDARGHLVQDAVREWRPRPGHPLNPEHILVDIRNLLDAYGVRFLYGDQYQLEALQSLARYHALSIVGIDLTGKSKAKILGSLQQLFLQDRIHLLDHYETCKQIKTLERKLSEGGNVLVAAPSGMRDDLAMVLALAVHQAGSHLPKAEVASQPKPQPTPFELGMAQSRTPETIRTFDVGLICMTRKRCGCGT